MLKSRRKGKAHENELCALLRLELGIVVQRELAQPRGGGPDILLPPFAIEVKSRKSHGRLMRWFKQAQVKDRTAVLALRADGGTWVMVMGFQEWVRMVREQIAVHLGCKPVDSVDK